MTTVPTSTEMTLRQKIEVLEAYERGEEIQSNWAGGLYTWNDSPEPEWNFCRYAYRVKPKPWTGYMVECPDGNCTVSSNETVAIVAAGRIPGARWFRVREVE